MNDIGRYHFEKPHGPYALRLKVIASLFGGEFGLKKGPPRGADR
jgi:hypothetical protein